MLQFCIPDPMIDFVWWADTWSTKYMRVIIINPCLLALLLSLTFFGATTAAAYAAEPWQEKHQQLQQQRDTIFTRLEQVRLGLEQRIPKQNLELLARLSPPLPRATGYGLLPVIENNPPLVAVEPKQTLYSLKWLEEQFNKELENINQVLTKTPMATDIEALVTHYEQSLLWLRTLESHLDYHQQWQKSVLRYPAFFKKKNQLVALIREINQLIADRQSPERVSLLRQQLMQSVDQFNLCKALTNSHRL
jgi:hypothetical protein